MKNTNKNQEELSDIELSDMIENILDIGEDDVELRKQIIELGRISTILRGA